MTFGELRCRMAAQIVGSLYRKQDLTEMNQMDDLAKTALQLAGRIIAWEYENEYGDTFEEAFPIPTNHQTKY